MTDTPLASEYIECHPSHRDGINGTINRIVVHGTVSPCVRGGARANARYFQSPTAGGAAHYIQDPGEAIQCVHENTIAYHAPPNSNSIGLEFCDEEVGDPARWQDANHEEMLHRGALLVRDIAERKNVPKVWLSVADLLAGKRGITSHANVAAAWHRTDHTDPVGFPVEHFMGLVIGGPPAPAPIQEDEMNPAWAVDTTGRLWEFVVGKDKACYACIEGVWDPQPLGGAWTSGLCARPDGTLIVVSGRGLDGALWHLKFDPKDSHNTVDIKSAGGHIFP